MAAIHEIRDKIPKGQFKFSRHAVDQSILRRINVQQIREAIEDGKVIEGYAEDKHGPSCRVLGFTGAGKSAHVHCSHPSRSLIKINTVYEPNPNLWIDFEVRKA